MPEYAPMLHVSYYAQNYADIIRQGLVRRDLDILFLVTASGSIIKHPT